MIGRSAIQIGAAVNKRAATAKADRRAAARARHLEAAIAYLGATHRLWTGWVYYADETRTSYLVTAAEMQKLGAMIDKSESPAAAYSEWAALTKSRPVEAR